MKELKPSTILIFTLLCFSSAARNVPFIGNLADRSSGVSVSAFRSLEGSAETGDSVSLDEALTINSFKIHDRGADLSVHLSEKCFIDHIRLNYSDSNPGVQVQALSPDGKALSEVTPLEVGENTVPVAAWCDNVVLRFRKPIGYLHGSSIGLLKDFFTSYQISGVQLHGAARLEEAVYPFPASLRYNDGVLSCISAVSSDRKSAFAARNFAEKYSCLYGKVLPDSRKGNVSFRTDATMDQEAFRIEVTPESATVLGGSPRAVLYGSEKLLQLCNSDGSARCAVIEDSPAFSVRGVHIGLPDRCNIDFLKRVVKYVLMPLGYNTVFLQVSGAMEYRKHPAINAAWQESIRKWKAGEGPAPAHAGFIGFDIISQDEVRDLCSFFRQYGLEIIPEVQSFSHTQYVTMAYPRIAEKPETVKDEKTDLHKADGRPSTVYYHTSCPNSKDYFNIFFDIIDEVIDVIRPERCVSIGHDEIYELAQCPLCREEGAAGVYAREVTALHDHIAAKGLRTAMWSDMLDEKKYASYTALDKIPKDIICMPFTWYFHLDSPDNIEDRTVGEGFDFIIGNLYSSHYPRFVQRSGRERCLGGEVSTWCRFDEKSLGFDGKIYDFIYSSGMLWSRGYKDDMRRTYTELVNSRIGDIRECLHYGAPSHGTAACPVPLENAGWEELPYDIRDSFGKGLSATDGKDAVIGINRKAGRILVSHATESPEDLNVIRTEIPEIPVIGQYIIEYEDGSRFEEDITYGAGIGPYRWAYGAPMVSNLFRHYGYCCTYFSTPVQFKTSDGRDATLWEYTIDNPYPEKKINSLRIMCNNERKRCIFIIGIKTK